MKLIATFLLIFISACETAPKYPIGGYDYPRSISYRDTNFYHYPIRDSLTKRDSFRASYDYLYYRSFDEPNLSIKPLDKETFRLSYSAALGESFIITLTDGLLISKEGDPSSQYEKDTSRLSQVEKMHLDLLNNRYPIDTIGRSQRQRRYLDSMMKLYPQLLSASYYHTLYEKSFRKKNEVFSYKLSTVRLWAHDYNLLMEEINSSGYWNLPHEVTCGSDMMDGYGFSLEANTRNKYKIVSAEGCPNDRTMFTKACQSIINYAKMGSKENLIWEGTIDTVKTSH